jgi:hypothetical protein
MEEEPVANGLNAHAADIMLDRDVSSNHKAVGGRKRAREDGDGVDYKRIRTHGSYSTQGFAFTHQVLLCCC